MINKLRAACIFLSFSIIVLLMTISSNNSSREEYFKEELFRLVDSANGIAIIIIDEASEDQFIELHYSLIRKIDRLRMFMAHSNSYIDIDTNMIFGEITSDIRAHLDDGVIDNNEIQNIRNLNSNLEELILSLGVEDEGEIDVNTKLTVDEVSNILENFRLNLDY